jgi:hypothetical protein
MRKARAVSLVLVVLATAAVLAAAALGLPVQRPDLTTTSGAAGVNQTAVVVKAPWMLSSYRWVEPVWVATDGTVLPTLPTMLAGQRWAQPPAWIQIERR